MQLSWAVDHLVPPGSVWAVAMVSEQVKVFEAHVAHADGGAKGFK